MSQNIHLIGAEDVRSAGNRMAAAAGEMSNAASSIDSTMEHHKLFMNDWLDRFERAVEKMPRTAQES